MYKLRTTFATVGDFRRRRPHKLQPLSSQRSRNGAYSAASPLSRARQKLKIAGLTVRTGQAAHQASSQASTAEDSTDKDETQKSPWRRAADKLSPKRSDTNNSPHTNPLSTAAAQLVEAASPQANMLHILEPETAATKIARASMKIRAASVMSGTQGLEIVKRKEWLCVLCKFRNTPDKYHCSMCNNPCPEDHKATIESLYHHVPDNGLPKDPHGQRDVTFVGANAKHWTEEEKRRSKMRQKRMAKLGHLMFTEEVEVVPSMAEIEAESLKFAGKAKGESFLNERMSPENLHRIYEQPSYKARRPPPGALERQIRQAKRFSPKSYYGPKSFPTVGTQKTGSYELAKLRRQHETMTAPPRMKRPDALSSAKKATKEVDGLLDRVNTMIESREYHNANFEKARSRLAAGDELMMKPVRSIPSYLR